MAETAWRRTNSMVAAISVSTLLLIAAMLSADRATVSARAPSSVASFNAIMNAVTVLALTSGYLFIRRGFRDAHRISMIGALVASFAFLCGYILHHASVGSVPYLGTGLSRRLYFAILIPHVVLAALEVPLVLLTVIHAFKGRFDQHRRIARVTLPVWLFVSASGVAVYFMLYWS